MKTKKITVFEHRPLFVDEDDFRQHHFDALVRFNEKHGGKYFTPGYRKITFKSYVGVIQVRNLIIEILPKADDLPENQVVGKWQSALLGMMKTAGFLRLNATEEASQTLQSKNLLDIYLYHFLQEVERLIHQGLVKKYRRVTENITVLKGKIALEKHITHNHSHGERFYTEHYTYDRDNLFNQLIKKAIGIIQETTFNSELMGAAGKLLLYFDEISQPPNRLNVFDHLVFDRKTAPYEVPLQLAKLVIQHYSPQLKGGREPVLAILLNMHQLFELFVYRLLKKEESNFTTQDLQIRRQPSAVFWKDQKIRADIILEYRNKGADKNADAIQIIIDTKWKKIKDERPSDEDLKQMFTYNFQFGSLHSILLYPYMAIAGTGKHPYERSLYFKEFEHQCEVNFARIFQDDGKFNNDWANGFLANLLG